MTSGHLRTLPLSSSFRTTIRHFRRQPSKLTYNEDAILPIARMRDHYRLMRQSPAIVADSRTLKMTILGAPNAGKSELTNRLVGSNISAVSSKIDTTRKSTTGVWTTTNTQVVIHDNPGLISRQRAKKVLRIDPDSRMVTDPEFSIEKADLVAVIFDCTASGEYVHHRIMHMLHRHLHIPSILIVNKVDLLTKDRTQLLSLVNVLTNGRVGGKKAQLKTTNIGKLGAMLRKSSNAVTLRMDTDDGDRSEWYQKHNQFLNTPTHKLSWSDTFQIFRDKPGWSHFDAVFYTSAITEEGVDSLKRYLLAKAERGDWRFHKSVTTTKSPKHVLVDCLRGKLLDILPKEIPYNLDVKIAFWEVDDANVLNIVLDVYAKKVRHIRALIGPGGVTLHRISAETSQELRDLFQQQVWLKIAVKDVYGRTSKPDESAHESRTTTLSRQC